MATTANDSTAYGGGAGGKFRKRPFRRPQTTPYDRPPTALRIARRNDDNSSTGGWLSRIVNPASKLITASAHKLYFSVFRKRLLPPPSPQSSQGPSGLDEEVETLENHLGNAVTEVPSRIQERDMIQGNTQNNDSIADGVEELEHILKQKTFTRSEIDRLTELLHSRTVDKIATEGQRRFELTPSDPSAGHSRQKEVFGTAFENGVNPSQFPGTELIPAVRSKVNVNDVASPTNIAKAYMGSRSSRVSPSVLGPISHAVREETPAFTALTLHRPSVSTVQKPSSLAGTYQKDLVVRRSQGRSAIYSMARTPYSRVQPTVTKGPGTSSDAFDGESLLLSQKVLKRRSSILENDIGSVGPMRRTRQKPNLLYPKTSGLSSSSTAFANATPSGVGEASSSKSQENRGEKGIPFSSPHISSKSIEMGQRILQQLEKLTPPKDKSNEKKPGLSGGTSAMELTPAMLRGQARKSLETVDSLKYVQHGETAGKVMDSLNASREVQDFAALEQDKFYDCSSKVLVNTSSKVYPENDEARIADNDVMIITKNTAPVVLKTALDVPRKSPAFQMSAYEDYLDLDDDAHLNGVASPSATEVNRNLGAYSMQSNGKLPEHPAFPGMEPPSNSALKKTTTVDSLNFAEKGISHSFSVDSSLNRTIGSSIPSLQPVSDKADNPASTTSFGIKSSDKVSPPLFMTSPVMESSIAKDVASSVFAFDTASTDAAIQSPRSNKKNTEAVNLFKQSDEPGSSSGTMSSLGSLPLPSSASLPVLFSFQSSSIDGSAQSTFTTAIGVSATKAVPVAADSATATAAISVSSNSLAGSGAFPSFQATFGGSSAVSDSSTLAISGTDIAGKSKETAAGNLTNGNLSGAASVTTQGPAVASFQFGASTTSRTNSQLQGSQNFSSRSVFGDQILPSATASALTISSVPSQPSVSVLPALSGTSSPVNSGSLTLVSVPFSSSSTFGSSSSASSSVAASGSTSSTSTNIFGANWQPTNSSVFGSALNNASSGLSFGASSAPNPSTSASSGVAFGTSSMSAPANGSSAAVPFGSFSTSAAGSSSATSGLMFGASAPTPSSSVSLGFTFGTSSIPAPGNGSPNGVPFGASSTSAASGSTPSVFGFGASSSASSSAPSSTFSFGASSTSAASSAPSSPFSFGASSTSASSSAPSSTFSFGASSAHASSSALPSTFLFGAPSTSASSSAPSSTFSFGASSTSASSSAPFSFGASSASSAPFSFGASSPSVTATPAPAFSFGAAAPTPGPTGLQSSQPAFGSASSVFGFGSTPSPSPLGSNDQMTMEDSMVEDSMQSHTAATPTPIFGQSPTNNFSFGMAQAQAQAQAPLGASPFQFGGQQSQVAAAPNPFQASGSFDGGSFSLGAGGNDKSNRRIVKVNKNRNRKK